MDGDYTDAYREAYPPSKGPVEARQKEELKKNWALKPRSGVVVNIKFKKQPVLDVPAYIHLIIGLFMLAMGLRSRSAGDEDEVRVRRFKAYAIICLGVPVVLRFIAFSDYSEGWRMWAMAWLPCMLVVFLYLLVSVVRTLVSPRPVINGWLFMLAVYTTMLVFVSIPME